jgi:hypothetical protein
MLQKEYVTKLYAGDAINPRGSRVVVVITVNKHSRESRQKTNARIGAGRSFLLRFCPAVRIRARTRENDLHPFGKRHIREEGTPIFHHDTGSVFVRDYLNA